MDIITFNHVFNKTYFFSTDHCQGIRAHSGINREYWVPVTSYLPMCVSPREGIEDGIVDTLERYIKVFHRNDVEVPNPNPFYTPFYRR